MHVSLRTVDAGWNHDRGDWSSDPDPCLTPYPIDDRPIS